MHEIFNASRADYDLHDKVDRHHFSPSQGVDFVVRVHGNGRKRDSAFSKVIANCSVRTRTTKSTVD